MTEIPRFATTIAEAMRVANQDPGRVRVMRINYAAEIGRAREELEWLRSRYDSGAVSDAVYITIKQLETDLSWAQHKRQRRHETTRTTFSAEET